MNWKRNISCGISELYALAGKITGPRSGFRVLLYHSVNSDCLINQRNDPLGIFTVNPQLFNVHINTLLSDSSISMVSLSEGLTLNQNNSRRVAITFDDGYKDNLYSVAPLLVKHGIPFTVFATSEFVQKGMPDFLTLGELQELSKLPGVDIGSHGATHTPLTDFDDKMLADELLSSRKYLEDAIGKEVTSISYPHGAVDYRVREAVLEAGYKIEACSRIDVNNNIRTPPLLSRTIILSNDSERVFCQKLNGDWDWYRFKQKNYNKST